MQVNHWQFVMITTVCVIYLHSLQVCRLCKYITSLFSLLVNVLSDLACLLSCRMLYKNWLANHNDYTDYNSYT